MKLPVPVAVALPPACAFVLFGWPAACGGGGASQTLGAPQDPTVELYPLEIHALGAPLAPLGLLATRSLEWRANQPGEYRVVLRPGGDVERERVLATGLAEAYETVSVSLRGAELDLAAPSTVSFALVDPIGRSVALAQELELKSFDVLPLGPGSFTDLAFDALRDEVALAVASSAELRIVDVDEGGASYGLTLATLTLPSPAGPLRLALAADGSYGYALGFAQLHEYERDTLAHLHAFALPAAAEPAGLAPTPDATRVYLSHPSTLLLHRADPGGGIGELLGTGLVDPEVQSGELAIAPDGGVLLFAWAGPAQRGLWIVGADPAGAGYHELLSDRRFAPLPGTPAPGVAVSESGRSAIALGLEGLSQIDLLEPGFPIVSARADLPAVSVAMAAFEGADFALAHGADGALWVLGEALELEGTFALPPGLAPRAAVDRVRGRLFLLRTTPAGGGELLILPLH